MAFKKPDLSDAINDDFKKRENLQPKKKELLNQRIFRIADTDWNILKAHFQDKGLSVSSGIRYIIKNYMSEKNL